MSPADLAVVIVNYNAGSYLGRCLDSLDAHRGDLRTDVLVIDNASSDGSQRQASDRPGVRLIENRENVYLSPAWNQGARDTDAPFLLFLNPDTEWWKGTLAGLVDEARANPRAGLVGPLVRNMDGSVYASGRSIPSVIDAVGHAFLGGVAPNNRFTSRYRLDDWDRLANREVDWVSGCCMLIPRDAFDEVGGFDERFLLYGEELDLATRLHRAGRSVLFTPVAEVLHEIGVSTGRGHRTFVMHSSSIYRYYRKHRAAGWRRLTLPLAWAALRIRAELEWIRTKAVRA